VSSTTVWTVIGACAVVTFVIKGIGPFALGGRELSPRVITLITLLAPAVLAALVATQAFADGDHLAIGADTAGVAVAGVSSWRGGSIVTAVILAAGVTALLRAI
jgi:branched-subunit amino acid transport protein